MGTTKTPIVGTEIKVKVGVDVGGANWKDLDALHPSPFTLEFYTVKDRTVSITGSAPTNIASDGTFTAVVDTGDTGSGTLQMRVTIDVYDDDMSGEAETDEAPGYRREIAIYNTGIKIYD